ncbi:hypothetical protein [Haloplanus rubicundus]|uniref:hypothetical protein n=1 Tax=Haloplanus rubicundus TaxID=1547898 RepID=UPI0013003783|nr:hypothetical protein [Haloplanus rubicundus]
MVSRFVSEKELAKTYDPEQGWETVTQFREAKQLRTEEPDIARAEIARRVGRKPSAVRGWLVEGKTPQVVKGLRVARERGWLNIESTSERFRAFNQLVAWVFAGGGLANEVFVPVFSVDDHVSLAALHQLLQWANIPYQVRNPKESHHALEVKPCEDASVCGRVLDVLGAPRGVKAHQESLSLPSYLNAVSKEHQRDFARVYVLNRAKDLDSSGTAGSYVHGLSSEQFAHEIQTLINSTTSGKGTVGAKQRVWVSSQSMRDLAETEPFQPALATKIAFGSLTPPTERALASTYRRTQTPGGYRSVQLYTTVVESDQSRAALADQYPDLSEAMVQSWRRGQKPYAQRAITTAHDLGWIMPAPESEIASGLTALLAWIMRRGSVRPDTHYPIFPIESAAEQVVLEDIGDDLGIPFHVVRREDNTKRSTEMRPAEHGALLGRILRTLGAPLGRREANSCLPPVYLYQYPSHADQFITTWQQLWTSNNEESQITVPTRLGDRFSEAFEQLMAKHLGSQ